MLIPIRQKNLPEHVPFVVYILIALNILIYALTSNGLQIHESALEWGGLSKNNMDLYRFMTSMFLHGDIFHIIGNMLFLWIFGRAVEGRLGWWKFTLVYILAGLLGDVLHLVLFGNMGPDIPMIGASGAIMGCVGAAVYMFPHAPVTFFYWIGWFWVGTFDIAMWGVGLIYFCLDLLGAFISGSVGGGGVANLAHIGGAIGGLLLTMAFRPARDSEYVAEAKSLLSETKNDYRMLTRTQLQDMIKVQPDNPDLALYMMVDIVRNGYDVTPEQWKMFEAHLPSLIADGEVVAMYSVLERYSRDHGRIPSKYLLQFTNRLDKERKPKEAFVLLDRIARDPKANPSDWETALYRMAQMREVWFQDWAGALDLYQMFLQNYPMSPMAAQAHARLAAMKQKVAAMPAQPPGP